LCGAGWEVPKNKGNHSDIVIIIES
jgi:hypothetical protein